MTGRERFDYELNEISDNLIRMGAAATNAIDNALTALKSGDRDLARAVIEGDREIGELERAIEQKCLRLLLRQQPVASDLRKISTAIKMITDIERIGDAAADIAEISIHLKPDVLPDILEDALNMGKVARDMTAGAIRAYVDEDLVLSGKVMAMDDLVDKAFLDIRGKIGDRMQKQPEQMDAAMDYLLIIKYLERIGDHAENVCEWIEFNQTGVHKKGKIL